MPTDSAAEPAAASEAQGLARLAPLLAERGGPTTVMVVQIDQLARINQMAGVAAGDAALHEIGQRLTSFAKEELGAASDMIRLDGPRFLLVPPAAISRGALQAQERTLHAALAAPMVGDPGGRLAIRIVTTDLDPARPLADQLRTTLADLARPTAARDGAQVQAALARGEVVVHYQPQYAATDGAMVGVEALLRWQHPDHGLLGAGPLVTAAHAARLDCELTERAHLLALTDMAAWPAALSHLRLSLNITAADLADGGFADRLAAMIAAARVDPARLTLELTEQAMLADPASAADQLGRLRTMGCAVAIDDFGTGYSSLSLLARLPIDYLKIDSGFTRALGESDRDRIVVRAIVDLARALGLAVVAEGVETDEQLTALRDLGVATWQGFLRSGPVPTDALVRLVLA